MIYPFFVIGEPTPVLGFNKIYAHSVCPILDSQVFASVHIPDPLFCLLRAHPMPTVVVVASVSSQCDLLFMLAEMTPVHPCTVEESIFYYLCLPNLALLCHAPISCAQFLAPPPRKMSAGPVWPKLTEGDKFLGGYRIDTTYPKYDNVVACWICWICCRTAYFPSPREVVSWQFPLYATNPH